MDTDAFADAARVVLLSMRADAKLSWRELGKRSGIDHVSLWHIGAGNNRPRLTAVYAWVMACGFTFTDFAAAVENGVAGEDK